MKTKNTFITLSLIASSVLCSAQTGELINGDFESWTNTSIYEFPDQWKNSNIEEWQGVAAVEKSTDASNGNYAVKLNSLIGPTNDTVISYVYHGTVGVSGPEGGIPYTDTFDEITFDYQSSMGTQDSLFVLLIRLVGGSLVQMEAIPVAYGNHSTWTSQSISVSSTAQDELFIGFIMANPITDEPNSPGSWALVDNMKLKSAGVAVTDLPDYSFESWSSQDSEGPDSWFSLNPLLAGSGDENVIKTTDAYSGSFAAELTTLFNPMYGDTIPSFISLGPIDINGGFPFSPAPYEAVPTTFSGAYKYSPVNGDQGYILLQFYKNGVMVGQHNEACNATTTYTTFNTTLSISATPDSLLFVASSGNNPGSTLILDDLSLSGGNVSIFENDEIEIEMYPNPTSDYLMVNINEKYSVEVYTITGSRILSRNNLTGWETIDVSEFANGKYLVKVQTKDNVSNKVFIKH